METKELILQKIANTLYVNVQQLPDTGLLNGKLGIALFMYHYSTYCGRSHYRDFADEYINFLYDTISVHTPLSFADGLAGIGWTLDHLISNGFLEGENDEILGEVDSTLADQELSADLEAQIPLFSPGIYFLQRGKNDKIGELIHRLESFVADTAFLPASYLNSALYVTGVTLSFGIEQETAERLIHHLMQRLHGMQQDHKMSEPEMLIFSNNIQSIRNSCYRNVREDFAEHFHPHIHALLKTGWSRVIYSQNFREQVSPDQIQSYVEDRILNLRLSDLSLYQGLPGIGLELMCLHTDQ